MIDKNGPIPLHHQLTTDLREGITQGMWGVGEVFPTDKELMNKYNISSTTVRHAVAQLVQEGWLDRRPGKGTFVKKITIEETLGELTGFFEEMVNRGLKPRAEVLKASPLEITKRELDKVPQLKLFNEKRMYFIEKIQKLNDEPIAYVRSYLPYEYGARIAEFDLSTHGIYELLRREFGFSLIRADETVGANSASEKVAQHLKVKVGFPLLTMERTAFNEHDALIELSINEYRSDRYKYKVHVKRSIQS